MTCLLPLARTVNLYKMKDFVGGVLEKPIPNPQSHYKRLIRFFRIGPTGWTCCMI
ncbi:MAG: hypothetical protein IPH12_16325 [Saprospirales bacterium]|nr:hypothetical protein [Saprospirales bacterium]